jgi:hypothetical protein
VKSAHSENESKMRENGILNRVGIGVECVESNGTNISSSHRIEVFGHTASKFTQH